jgi:hypothetical protein
MTLIRPELAARDESDGVITLSGLRFVMADSCRHKAAGDLTEHEQITYMDYMIP